MRGLTTRFHCTLETASSKQWYVSRISGTDLATCGTEEAHPCKKIDQATARAQGRDVINIDGRGSSRDPYSCEFNPELLLAAVSIHSYRTQAFVSCKVSSFRFSCNNRNNSFSSVSLERITFMNTSLYLSDCSLKLTEVYFVNSSIDVLSLDFPQGSTGKIELSGCSFYNNSGTGLRIRGDSIKLIIGNSSFSNSEMREGDSERALMVILTKSSGGQISINATNVTLSHNSCSGKACMKIGSGINGISNIKMDKGKIENNKASESVVDITGTSVVEFSAMQFRQNNGRAVSIRDGDSVKLNITNGNFTDNEIHDFHKPCDGGAVLISRFTQEALVFMSSSSFTSNTANNGGACAFSDLWLLTLDIDNCDFVRNEGWGSGGALAVGNNYTNWQEKAIINIRNSNFDRNTLYYRLYNKRSYPMYYRDFEGGGAVAFYILKMLNLTFTNNTFTDNKAEEKNAGAFRANIGTIYQDAIFLNCSFVGNSGTINSGTFQLSISDPLYSSPPRVTMNGCSFVKNTAYYAYGIGTYDIFLNQSYLTMSSCTIQNNSGGGVFLGAMDDTCDVYVENSLISDNENFKFSLLRLNELGSDASFKFSNVSILRNNCKAKSSVFHISLPHNRNSLHFQSSKFEENFCKSGVVKISVSPYLFKNRSVANVGTTVFINNTLFRGNSGVAESTLTIMDPEVIQIENSSFINNFGGNDGSHMRVQLSSSRLQIYKTNFSQSKESQVFNIHREKPYNGFLTVTSFGNMSVRESSFISDPVSYDGKALVFVKGADNVYMDHSVTVQSPLGSKLNLHNFTHWESLHFGKWLKEILITSFAMSMQPCPVGTYSIRRGTSKGLDMEHLVKCYSCPNGGNCTAALAARPNFWGYPTGDRVHFTLCPLGYCCAPHQKCLYHNASYWRSGCQGKRTGTLCGKCKKNLTEALFSANCVPVEKCHHWWYLVVIFSCTTLFGWYLIEKPPLFQKIATHLVWFFPNQRKKDFHHVDKLENDSKSGGRSSFSSDGFLKILFYFYQIASLLTTSSQGVRELLKDTVVLPIISLFDFKVYPHSKWDICPFPGLTPLSKTLFQVVTVVAVYLSILLIYLVHSGLNKLRKRSPALPSSGPYLGAVLETVLLGYSAATGTAMRLLDCVQIQHVPRWYYNAEITCLQWWQKACIVAIVLYLFPFIFALLLGSLRLHRQQMSGKLFLLACVFPLPFLLYAFVVYLTATVARPPTSQVMTSMSSSDDVEEDRNPSPRDIEESVLEVLSGPFCNQNETDQAPSKVYWESILIGRRFILILIASFVAHAFLRSVCLAVLCLAFLLHHLSQNPFVKFHANLAETVSLATLVVIAILNVGVASYYSAGIEAHGLEHKYVRGFLLAEAVLLSFIPVLTVIFLLLSLASQLVRLLMILYQVIRGLAKKSKSSQQQEQREPLIPPE